MAEMSKATLERGKAHTANQLKFQPTTGKSREFKSWFRGAHTNKQPGRADLYSLGGLRRYVLHGFAPPEPLIDEGTRITAFGSCFAANISNHLAKRNFTVSGRGDEGSNAYVVRCGEGMVNSFVIRQQFEWAWENKTFDGELWHGYDKEAYGYDEEVRLETKRIFDATDLFILTFGLSEVWYDEPTGNVFWRTIPQDVYDPARHKFRVTTVEENQENLTAIRELIRRYRPDAKVIYTLSPIPLIATFRDQSCMASNAVSKAVLRIAIDQFMTAHAGDPDTFYWPSYEMVTSLFEGAMMADMRHPEPATISFIMSLFETAWCKGRDGQIPILTDLAVALGRSGHAPARLATICENRNRVALERFLTADKVHPDAACDAAIRDLARGILAEWEREAQATAAE